MATYAIGDIQGCMRPLQRLLEHIQFDPTDDRLWFAGDLVNRGPDSLDVLRFVHGLEQRATVVLGNHDLHLLAVAAGAAPRKNSDTLDDILNAPDCDSLLDWLRKRPLLHWDAGVATALIHAGLPPQWDMPQAMICARAVEEVLQGPHYSDFLAAMYGNRPERWSAGLNGNERLRFIVNCLTRLRFVYRDGRLALNYSGSPDSHPEGAVPWFQAENRRSHGARLVFGHWSQLGHVHWPAGNVFGLDTGCVWGGALTALRLEDEALFSMPCQASREPAK